jgi:hypothetical protein
VECLLAVVIVVFVVVMSSNSAVFVVGVTVDVAVIGAWTRFVKVSINVVVILGVVLVVDGDAGGGGDEGNTRTHDPAIPADACVGDLAVPFNAEDAEACRAWVEGTLVVLSF